MPPQFPDPPFYLITSVNGRCLELGGGGTYAECQSLLQELRDVFGASYSEHLEYGDRPECDKEKGYWNVEIFGQEFFLMRVRGDGITLWGPKPPADVDGFLKVARHFGAQEYLTWWQRIGRWFRPEAR